jgi:hypothetical protein
LGAAGIQTAALAFGGITGPDTGATEEYDGTSWATSSPASLNTARTISRSRNSNGSFSIWWFNSSCYRSNRRMDRCRSSSNKNNYSKLTGGKYGTYKNIHRS